MLDWVFLFKANTGEICSNSKFLYVEEMATFSLLSTVVYWLFNFWQTTLKWLAHLRLGPNLDVTLALSSAVWFPKILEWWNSLEGHLLFCYLAFGTDGGGGESVQNLFFLNSKKIIGLNHIIVCSGDIESGKIQILISSTEKQYWRGADIANNSMSI